MRHSLLLFILTLSACGAKQSSKTFVGGEENHVIYGEDGRQDYFEVNDPEVQKLARSTAALIDVDNLKLDAANQFYRFVLSDDIQMCASEKFQKQTRVAFCSGTLIAPDLILTAGHCVRDEKECRSVRFVFDYRLEAASSRISGVKDSQVFRCAEVVQSTETKNAADFAILRLDRPVMDREPLHFSDEEPRFHEPLMVIGHPAGYPTKITLNGQVRSLIPDQYFTASVDSFSGNSGSAVFNQTTKLIVGVLSRGGQDYERKNSCYVSYQCDEDGCRGEDVTRASVIKKYLPKP